MIVSYLSGTSLLFHGAKCQESYPREVPPHETYEVEQFFPLNNPQLFVLLTHWFNYQAYGQPGEYYSFLTGEQKSVLAVLVHLHEPSPLIQAMVVLWILQIMLANSIEFVPERF